MGLLICLSACDSDFLGHGWDDNNVHTARDTREYAVVMEFPSELQLYKSR